MRTLVFALVLTLSACLGDDQCTGGSVRKDGLCKCPAGTVLVGDQCKADGDGGTDAGGDGDAQSGDGDSLADGSMHASDSGDGDGAVAPGDGDAGHSGDGDSGADAGESECADLGNGCKPAYPCTPTDSDGYTCLGQYADWPMPDKAGPLKPSYSATADEVVDNVTSLVWQRAVPASYVGCKAGDSCAWDEAVAYCKSLKLAGNDDWRLPSKIELESIVDETKAVAPMIDSVFTDTPAEWFWTSSPYAAAIESSVWAVSFEFGMSLQRDTPPIVMDDSDRAHVRCVRGVRSTSGRPADRFASVAVAQGREVHDSFTGLTWLIEDDATFRTWTQADEHCSGLGNGYRMPAYKELQTIIDPTRANPALDTQVFQGLVGDWFSFWSSSVVGSQAWQLEILYGQGLPEDMTSTSLVLCVR